MPIFEFVCHECGHIFEELLRNSEATGEITCPKCRSMQVKRKISSFASKVSGGSSISFGSTTASSCNPGGT